MKIHNLLALSTISIALLACGETEEKKSPESVESKKEVKAELKEESTFEYTFDSHKPFAGHMMGMMNELGDYFKEHLSKGMDLNGPQRDSLDEMIYEKVEELRMKTEETEPFKNGGEAVKLAFTDYLNYIVSDEHKANLKKINAIIGDRLISDLSDEELDSLEALVDAEHKIESEKRKAFGEAGQKMFELNE